MRYLIGKHALNLMCRLKTTGDWHTSALKWENLTIRDTEDSVFGMWGIDLDPPTTIPNNESLRIPIANHLRAVADLLEIGYFTVVSGFKNDWIDVDDYDDELMEHVLLLQGNENWPKIDKIMRKEYGKKWLSLKAGKEPTRP